MKDEDSMSMVKVWLALEVRQFIHASIQDVRIISMTSWRVEKILT